MTAQQRAQIIDLAHWYSTPSGRALRQWQLQHCDQAVADCFGFQAVQIGADNMPLLRNSRIRHRFIASVDGHIYPLQDAHSVDEATSPAAVPRVLVLEPHALPFAPDSLDLIVLPHTLEASADPHAVLREVARVLVPEGRLVLFGFNPTSLWGVQQSWRRLQQRLCSSLPPFIPDMDDFISQRRLRDWLGLLNLQVTADSFGCYRPGLLGQRWFERLAWLEQAGSRWWPAMGGVYMLQAVKRIHGARLIQPRWRQSKQSRALPVAPRLDRAGEDSHIARD